MTRLFDIVTVVHNDAYVDMALALEVELEIYEPHRARLIIWDNRLENLGFAAGCNRGAAAGDAPYIGFLNPDAHIKGEFLSTVQSILDKGVSVTGCRYDKPASHLKAWGVKEWVCGAAFFTTRDHWESLDGFDEGFEWSFEETDFIRRTEKAGGVVSPARLPITHSSPAEDSPKDKAYKEQKFKEAQLYYNEKWRHGA